VVETDRRAGDPPMLTADASKAQKELGWKTQYPKLETIVESAWKFHSDHPNGYGG
jgi:UDP-glucose 4-epimerase